MSTVLRLRAANKMRKLRRRLSNTLKSWDARLNGLSGDIDLTPLSRDALVHLLAPSASPPTPGDEIGVYTTYCGPLSKFTYDRKNEVREWPHYFISNNETVLRLVESLGWQPIFLDVPVSQNGLLAAHQAKVAKALPHLFDPLRAHRFLVYSDDKRRINHSEFAAIRETLTQAGGAMALRLSPHIKDNVLWEFTDSLFQDRYRLQAHNMLRYVLSQLEAGKTLQADRLFTTNFIFRDTAHPDCASLNEAWYDAILSCGIDCQLTFDFLAQGDARIVDLPAPPRKKYLGKRLDA